MKPDFTIAGTKLPVIPKGTRFNWLQYGTFKHPYGKKINAEIHLKKEDYVSFGKYVYKNKTYIKCERKSYKKECYYLFKLSTIERLAKEQVMYNTNNENMKPIITLQNDGSVQIANTTTIDAETVNTIFELKKAESEKPKFRKLELEKWYKLKNYPNVLVYYQFDNEKGSSTGYGINNDGEFEHDDDWSFKSRPEEWTLATPQEVQQRLTDYAVNVVGMKEGVYVDRSNLDIPKDYEKVIQLSGSNCYYHQNLNKMTMGLCDVFKDGIWASIIQPTKITASELLREQNKIVVG